MNRLLWTLIGLLLAGVGVLGLLFDLAPNFRRFLAQWRSWGDWALAGVAAAGLLAAVLGWLLLRSQLRLRGAPAMADLEPETRNGRTFVATRVMTRSLAQDLQSRPGISRASAHLSGDPQRPRLQLWLTVDPDTNLRRAQEWVNASIRRFTDTTDLNPASLSVDTRISHGSVGRVA